MSAGQAESTGSAAAGIVMAAGQGTRFASDVPKVMHRVAGRPMLAHVVDTGRAAGLEPLVVVMGPSQWISLPMAVAPPLRSRSG